MAGSMFALATAIKVFPVAVLPYLVWRRQWAAAASMLVFLGVFLFVLPAPFRGFQHNAAELKTWYQGMVGIELGEGVWPARRAELVLGQSVDHRGDAPADAARSITTRTIRAKPARTMNVVDLDFKTANWIVLAISLAIGLGYLAVMPPASRRTERSDAEELGILFCLMTVASPLARQYYFHVAVLSDHGADPSRRL